MKKMMNKKVLKGIASVFAALAVITGAFAIIRETTWGDSLEDGFRESLENGIYTPGRYAFDGDADTYWAVGSGKKEGYVERYFSEEKDIEGISVDLYLNEGSELSVYWEKDGTLLPYENGKIRGAVEGVKTIRFPEDARKTKHVLIKLTGEEADECRINEIQLKIRQDSSKYGKITPLKYSFNQEEYINIQPSRLWNGYVEETWYEPLWYIPWEIQQTTEGKGNIFAPFNGHPSKNAEIIWELDSTYRIDAVKAYFSSEWRDIAFEFWDGENWFEKTELKGNTGRGWYKQYVDGNTETDKVRITFPSGWEMARYINQIEVWGEGTAENTERKVLVSKDEKSGTYRASISDANEKGFAVSVTTEKTDKITLKINEETKTSGYSYTDGQECVFWFDITEDDIRKGTQFLEIEAYGKEVESVSIRNTRNDGRIYLGSYYTDGNREYSCDSVTENESKTFELDRKYELERIRIYADVEDGIKVENNPDELTYFECTYNERGYWEAELGGIEKDSIRIVSEGDFIINEIELYGSPLEDKDVCIEVWNHRDDVTRDSCILGWIGNSQTLVTVDGNINTRQADNLYWMPVKETNGSYLNTEKHEATAALNGKTTVRKYKINAEDDTAEYESKTENSSLALSIDMPYGKILTQNGSIDISGSVGNGNEIRVYVDGIETEVKEDRYSVTIELHEGTQTVTVRAEDATGRSTEKTVEIEMDSIIPEIEILSPFMNQYINTGVAEFCVDGNEEELWWQFNDEEWERGFGRYKYKDYVLEDGFYTYTVRAEDRAGNISETESVDFCMDKTIPESFDIRLNVSGWTNNNTPIAEFETTDQTSGVDHYEYRIDEENWKECTSPLQLETLQDGKRLLQVRAIDRARNIREENIEIDVDTSCPPLPANIRPVPDEHSIFMKWTGLDDNSISDGRLVVQEGDRGYRIERSPEWSDGVRFLKNKGYGDLTYEDTETEQGASYSYRIWTVDRAGNESEKSEWMSAIAGLAVTEIAEEGSTYIEFEGLTVTLPEGTTAEDIVRIQINEVSQSMLTEDDAPLNPLLGGIYSVTAVRKNGDTETVTNHADLLNDATLEIGYSRLLLPENYDETQMAVFYYDDLWGSWVRMKDCYIDTENQVVRCQTNHFTEFSVQATKNAVLTEAELREGAYSLSSSGNGYQGIDISGEDGGVSTRFIEFTLPGKNGLDISVQRVYSTSKALEDSVEGDKVDIDGEKVWKIADGWRINMPYMMWNSNSISVYGTDGMSTSLSQMSVKSEEVSGGKKKLFMESHEYTDLITEIDFVVSDHRFLWWSWDTYKFEKAVLHQGDGKKVYYGKDGKVTKITDCTGKNSIVFDYKDSEIAVTDSYGRAIKFSKANGMITGVTSGDKTVSYTVSKTKNSLTDKEKSNKQKKEYVYELSQAADCGSRVWKYVYDTKILKSSSYDADTKLTEKEKEEAVSRKFYTALTGITGPEIGYTEIAYHITEDLHYVDEMESYGKKYKYDVYQDKIAAYAKTVWESEADYTGGKDALRTTSVMISFAAPVEKNIYVSGSQIYDGKTTVATEYGTVRKERNRISQAPEAIRKTTSYDSSVADAKNDVQILTYAKKTTTYTGTAADENILQTDTNTVNETFMRFTDSVSVRGNSSRTDSYKYDSNGNALTESHVYKTDKTESSTSVTRTYAPETNRRTNLVKTVETKSSGTDGSTVEYEEYGYNTYGQVTRMYKGDSDATDKTSVYTYSYNTNDGQLAKTVSPEKKTTEYEYTAPADGKYKNIIKYKAVKGLDEKGSTKDVSETSVYELKSGNLIRSEDRDGYITEMEYDALGRITSQKKYHTSGTDSGETSSISIVYDDSKRTSTVTDELECVTENSYDSLGRLVKVTKTGKTYEYNKIYSEAEKTITIKLEYDRFDRVVKMTEPSYGIPSLEDGKFRGTTYNYDAQDRILRSKDADGNIAAYTYDDAKNTVKSSIKHTNKTAEALDESSLMYRDYNGNEIKVIQYYDESNNLGNTVSVSYDGKGRKLKVTDAKGNSTKYTYNSLGLLAKSEYADGLCETNTYDKDGNLVKNEKSKVLSSEDSVSVCTEYRVNAFGNVYEEKTPVTVSGTEKKLYVKKTYDGRGNILKEQTYYDGSTDIRTVSRTYDWNGKVLTETDGAGKSTKYTYDAKGNVKTVTDPRQDVTSYTSDFKMTMEYDSFGRLIKGTLPKNNKTKEAVVYMSYDAHGNNTNRKDPEGVETAYEYTAGGKLKKSTTDGYVTEYEYNGAGKVTKQTNPDGTWQKTEYDNAGRPVYESIKGSDVVISYTYDKNGNVKTVTDRNKNVTSYNYDCMNRVEKVTYADHSEKKMTYDFLGRIETETDGESNVMTYEYDELGRITKETVNTVPETELKYEYDARGNVTKYTDAKGIIFVREYTKTDRLEKEKVYESEVEEENLKETWDYTYDEAGMLKSGSDGSNTVYYNGAEKDATYQPDAYGNTRKEYWSSTGLSMEYGYDNLNRLTSVTTPDGKKQEYSYNNNSQVSELKKLIAGNVTYDNSRIKSVSLADGKILKGLGYSDAGLVSEIKYTSGTNVLSGWKYAYDKNFNVKTRTHIEDSLIDSYSYDGLNRLTSSDLKGKFRQNSNEEFNAFRMNEIDRDIDGLASQKDATLNGQKFSTETVILDEKGKAFVYDFAKTKEIERIELFKNNYSAKSRVRERDFHIYTKTGEDDAWTELKPEEWTFSSDLRNQSIRFDLKETLSARFIKIRTIWDDRNIDDESISDYATFKNVSIQKMLRIWTMSDSRSEEYEYDKNSNRTSLKEDGKKSSYTYYKNENNGNTARVKSDGRWHYIYDENGNRTYRAAALNEDKTGIDSTKEYWKYTWDYHNRLVEVQQYNAPDSATEVLVQYEYDVLNRRISRTSLTNASDDGSGKEETVYAYGRNGALTYEKKNVDAKTYARTFVYLNNQIIGFLDRDAAGNVEYRYTVTDMVGSVTEVYDKDASLLWKSGYTAFGISAGTTVDKFDSVFSLEGLFTGKDADEETGLTYHWNRWRSEDGCSWLTQDPARDGSNWYGYAGQNPVSFVDPTGLAAEKQTQTENKNGNQSESPNIQQGPTENPAPQGPDAIAMPQDVNLAGVVKTKNGLLLIFVNEEMVKQLKTKQNEVLNDEDLKEGTGGPFKRTLISGITWTWCNQATFKTARVTDPELAKAMYNEDDPTGDNNTKAAHIYTNLSKAAKDPKSNICEISPLIAQLLANAGVTVAGVKDVEAKGHVATVAPGYDFDSENGPMMANVGGADKQGYTRAKSAYRTSIVDGKAVSYYEQGKVHFYANKTSIQKVIAYIEIK